MRHLFTNSLLVVLLAGSGAVIAAEHGGMDHSAMKASKKSTAQLHPGQGKVNHVDMAGGKVNLTHGPIESLGWPGMTMDFKVKDKAILEGIKPGQQVEFDVVKEGPGKFFITRIAPSK